MDLPIYVMMGLLASGYALNQSGKQARKTPPLDPKKRSDQHENKKAGGNNIFDSGYFNKVREIEDELVIKNFEKSFDPINTNIIPHFFGNLTESNVKKTKNPLYDRNLFMREVARIIRTCTQRFDGCQSRRFNGNRWLARRSSSWSLCGYNFE
jgi:hypothetical protein